MTADKKVLSDYNFLGVPKKNRINIFTYGVSFLYILVLALFVFNFLTLSRVMELENEVRYLKENLSTIRSFDDNLEGLIGFDDGEEIAAYDSDLDLEGETNVIIPNHYLDEYDENDTNFDKYINFERSNSDANESEMTKPLTAPSQNDTNSRRRKRNIVAATEDGVIINSESYAEKKARNVSSRYSLRGGSLRQYPARPSSIGTPWPSSAPYRETRPTKAPDMYTRSSRVKQDTSKPIRQKVKLANLKYLESYRESNEDATTFTPPITVVKKTGYRRRSIKHLPSVHYNGDTSKYVPGVHENFLGNDQLRHLDDIFVDWKPTEWVETLKMHSHFTMDNGYVTVKQTGLYLIYAQIYYLDTHDTVGYNIYKNDKVILQCALTSPPVSGERMKGNTCFTGRVEHFRAGDRLSLSDIDQRLSLFADGKSFFGLVKLGNINV